MNFRRSTRYLLVSDILNYDPDHLIGVKYLEIRDTYPSIVEDYSNIDILVMVKCIPTSIINSDSVRILLIKDTYQLNDKLNLPNLKIMMINNKILEAIDLRRYTKLTKLALSTFKLNYLPITVEDLRLNKCTIDIDIICGQYNTIKIINCSMCDNLNMITLMLTKLLIKNSNISTIDLNHCDALEEVSITDCLLTTFVCKLNKLKLLDISNNFISIVDIKADNLTYLNAGNNRISDISFEYMKRVTHVKLNHNSIQRLNHSMYSLIEIDLSSNKLRELNICATNLKKLYVQYNFLVNIPPLHYLQYLNANYNRLIDIPCYPNIVELSAVNNNIQSFPNIKLDRIKSVVITVKNRTYSFSNFNQ